MNMNWGEVKVCLQLEKEGKKQERASNRGRRDRSSPARHQVPGRDRAELAEAAALSRAKISKMRSPFRLLPSVSGLVVRVGYDLFLSSHAEPQIPGYHVFLPYQQCWDIIQ